ncbi:MAG: peptide chain release factor N(5)-glutamine methyltransferase [Gammaproteobacteria bacterium]|nr:peptide chain release factor N(5)-glutamine methyltransferase [Gammaproteobacteria bacterium]
MTLREALRWAFTHSNNPTDPTVRIDLEHLLSHVLQQPRSYLHTWPDKALTLPEETLFLDSVKQHQQGTPLAYLIGKQAFWSLNFYVSPAVLIPRADTEVLIQLALEKLPSTPIQVLELGTGSGCIAVTLAHERPDWQILSCDVSADALQIAEKNRARYQLTNLQFRHSHWYDAVDATQFDLIISNPPYIADDDAHLRDLLPHEPLLALTAGADGLNALRHIIQHATHYLKPAAYLILEMGYDQADGVRDLLKMADFFNIHIHHDIAGRARAVSAQASK